MSQDKLDRGSGDDDKKTIKCVVWDLDHTLWDGILLEDGEVHLRAPAARVIKTLDERGILNSIASRNDYDAAMGKLRALGLAEYFLYPQIHWGTKSSSIEAIAKAINIGVDAIAFVDDQPFERDEVRHSLPQILCIDAADAERIPELPEMNPRFITEDSRMRRQMYLSDIVRKQAEEEHHGAPDDFLASLDMRFTIAAADEGDLARAEELTLRTNQLNATGYTYSYDELDNFRRSADHDLFVSSLEDKYGTYGKIGLALVERRPDVWTIKLLLMSCRVMSRGVGTIMLNHILTRAKDAGVRLRAEFVSTSRNRTMYVTYKFAGFREIERDGDRSLLENDLSHIQPVPPYLRVELDPS